MSLARILVSRLLTTEERAALSRAYGGTHVGNTLATSWAEQLIADELRRLIAKQAEPARGCSFPACSLPPDHDGEHLVPVTLCSHRFHEDGPTCSLRRGHAGPHVARP